MTTTSTDTQQKLPDGWKWVNARNIFDIKGGTQPPKSEFEQSSKEGYIRLLQIRDFASDENAIYVKDNSKLTTCSVDDVLIGRYGASVGKILTGKAGALNVAIVKTIPNEQLLHKPLLYYVLISPYFQQPLLTNSSRAAQNGFNRDDISKISIPLPPLEEQKRIAGVLNKKMAAVEEAKKAVQERLEAAKALPAAYLREVFPSSEDELPDGWKWVKLGDVAFYQEGPGLRSWQWTDSGMKVVNATNVLKDGSINIANTSRFISLSEFNTKYRHFAVESGDLLLVSSGASYGKVGQVDLSDLPLMMNTSVIRLHPVDNTRLAIHFLYSYLKTTHFISQIDTLITGSAQPNFGPSHLAKVAIPLPPLEEQKRIASKLDDKLAGVKLAEASIQQELDTIEAMPASLLRKAFKGEL